MNQLSPVVQAKVEALIQSAENRRAASQPSTDLFGDQTHTHMGIAIHFFKDCIRERGRLSRNTVRAAEKHIVDLPDDPWDAYLIVNEPKHDLRNALIRNEVDIDIDIAEDFAELDKNSLQKPQ